MARIVPLTLTATLLAGAAFLLAPATIAQDPGGLPAVGPSMLLERVGDDLRITGDTPGAPLWLIVGAERTRLPVAGVLIHVEPDLILPVGTLDQRGEALVPLRGELPRFVEEAFWFQALALAPDPRLVTSNPQLVTLPVEAPALLVHDKIAEFDPTVELFRTGCGPLLWTSVVSLTVPTSGYELVLRETQAGGNLFQATVELLQPAPDALVAPVITPLALGVDCIGPNPVERVEITLITSFVKP